MTCSWPQSRPSQATPNSCSQPSNQSQIALQLLQANQCAGSVIYWRISSSFHGSRSWIVESTWQVANEANARKLPRPTKDKAANQKGRPRPPFLLFSVTSRSGSKSPNALLVHVESLDAFGVDLGHELKRCGLHICHVGHDGTLCCVCCIL